MTAWSGLGLLLLVAAGIVFTGLPAFVVLIAVASFGAVLGVASGAVPYALLTALPGRLINLLENDLLQALPLYVMMGLLLDRLPIAQGPLQEQQEHDRQDQPLPGAQHRGDGGVEQGERAGTHLDHAHLRHV